MARNSSNPPPRTRYEGDQVNFNQRTISWDGTRVFGDSQLHGDLKVDKHPYEPGTPNIHTDGNLEVELDTTVHGEIQCDGNIYSDKKGYADDWIGEVNLNSRKDFDIPHPSKPGWRLRHTCLEGPENGIYIRGRLTNKNVIELPDYWADLVDSDTVTVTLTQIGCSQDLIVEKIESGKNIIIKSGNGSNIDCYYVIHGDRKDGEKLIPEYEGESPDDYPGNNAYYSIVGYNYDIRRKD